MATQRNVLRHPAKSPMNRPKGSPKIIAIEVPVTTMPMAVDWYLGGTMRTATGAAMDQKIEWVQATPIRAARSI